MYYTHTILTNIRLARWTGAIRGGAAIGMIAGNYIGNWADKKDKQRNHNLIQKVLDSTKDIVDVLNQINNIITQS